MIEQAVLINSQTKQHSWISSRPPSQRVWLLHLLWLSVCLHMLVIVRVSHDSNVQEGEVLPANRYTAVDVYMASQNSPADSQGRRLGHEDRLVEEETVLEKAATHPHSRSAQSSQMSVVAGSSSSPDQAVPAVPSAKSTPNSTSPGRLSLKEKNTQENQGKKEKATEESQEQQSFASPLARTAYEGLLRTSQDILGKHYAGEVGAQVAEDVAADAKPGHSVNLSTRAFGHMSYLSKLEEQFVSVWEYPYQARLQRLSGKVKVRFRIMENGKLELVQVLVSSGYAILDQGVVQALQKAAPFDRPPERMLSLDRKRANDEDLMLRFLWVEGTFVYYLF